MRFDHGCFQCTLGGSTLRYFDATGGRVARVNYRLIQLSVKRGAICLLCLHCFSAISVGLHGGLRRPITVHIAIDLMRCRTWLRHW